MPLKHRKYILLPDKVHEDFSELASKLDMTRPSCLKSITNLFKDDPESLIHLLECKNNVPSDDIFVTNKYLMNTIITKYVNKPLNDIQSRLRTLEDRITYDHSLSELMFNRLLLNLHIQYEDLKKLDLKNMELFDFLEEWSCKGSYTFSPAENVVRYLYKEEKNEKFAKLPIKSSSIEIYLEKFIEPCKDLKDFVDKCYRSNIQSELLNQYTCDGPVSLCHKCLNRVHKQLNNPCWLWNETYEPIREKNN